MQNSNSRNRYSVLISGIGSGSLGLELIKCLSMEEGADIYGSDIDQLASGHGDKRFAKTFVVSSPFGIEFIKETIDICRKYDISYVVPGSEATNKLICYYQDEFKHLGITPLVNSREVFDVCSNKVRCNEFLRLNDLPSLETRLVGIGESLDAFPVFPAVVKPVSDSGGSNLVFLAENLDEAAFFTAYLSNRGYASCVQEYIVSEDEFTVGVLSSPSKSLLSSIALKRNFKSKLSRLCSYKDRVLSSGWSQGRINIYPEVCKQSEAIANALGSTWAINIQGRIKNGLFIPFEINPRHSGTSYFRALAGVNEICMGLHFLRTGETRSYKIRSGQFNRVLEDRYSFDA
jgi:carbamoyl-phosphate synthase large subunit